MERGIYTFSKRRMCKWGLVRIEQENRRNRYSVN